MSKETSTKEIVVGGALVGGLIFFGVLTNNCQGPLDFLKGKEVVSGQSLVNGEKDLKQTVIALEEQIEDLKDNSTDEKIIGDLKARLVNERAQSAGKLTSLNERNEDLESEVQVLKAKTQLIAGSQGASQVVEEITGEDLSAFKSEMDTLRADLTKAELENQKLSKHLSLVSRSEQPPVVDQKSVNKLKEHVELLETKNQELTNKLNHASKKMQEANANNVANSDLAEMNTKISDLSELNKQQKAQLNLKNGQIAELSAHVNKLRAAKNVFVESANDLPQAAQRLFADLKTLEGKSQDEVDAVYAQYVSKHGALAKKRIKFSSGSSSLSDNDRKEIAQLTSGAGNNAYFFIVGYADQSGDAAGNKKLSSARSTSVAKELGVSAKGFQSAQAVYLGQTDRFGAPSENRVVEIWEIK